MNEERPEVKFSIPETNPEGFGVQESAPQSNYEYSSINCVGCAKESGPEPWSGLALSTVAITMAALLVLFFARVYIFKIHETSRN